jgi:hypothetical protein
MRRTALISVIALLLSGVYASPSSARPLHRITEAQAYGIANQTAEVAYDRTTWADEWEDECNRQTPWTFSCSIEIWSEAQEGPDCRREFDVASSIFTGRVRIEEATAWTCS